MGPDQEWPFKIYLRRVSRRRCVKTLMALGCGRNDANRIARMGAAFFGSYAMFLWTRFVG